MHHGWDVTSGSVDGLVRAGVDLIKAQGASVTSRGLGGKQCYNVQYWLTDPRNRVHTLRAPLSIRYFARELIAYCDGSRDVSVLARASKVWNEFADEEGVIYSNYGFYTFHQPTPSGVSQYEWVAQMLKQDLSSRRAVIVIDSISAKTINSKDLPCTLGMHFFVEEGSLCASISMRSTDIITGLPYDIGFFSFVLELLLVDIQTVHPHLSLGYCVVKSNLTQLYDSRSGMASALKASVSEHIVMPPIEDARLVLSDIRNKTFISEPMAWCLEKAEYEA